MVEISSNPYFTSDFALMNLYCLVYLKIFTNFAIADRNSEAPVWGNVERDVKTAQRRNYLLT